MPTQILLLEPETDAFTPFLHTTDALEQTKYILSHRDYYQESLLIAAFDDVTCAGFLRLVIQIIGSDEDRPPVFRENIPLTEGFVEAFGVLPAYRRQGIGQQMQDFAISLCRARRCYQIRSRSPINSVENYALKIKMGYAIHPSNENDSYYFIKTL